jgi:hypothetical protein
MDDNFQPEPEADTSDILTQLASLQGEIDDLKADVADIKAEDKIYPSPDYQPHPEEMQGCFTALIDDQGPTTTFTNPLTMGKNGYYICNPHLFAHYKAATHTAGNLVNHTTNDTGTDIVFKRPGKYLVIFRAGMGLSGTYQPNNWTPGTPVVHASRLVSFMSLCSPRTEFYPVNFGWHVNVLTWQVPWEPVMTQLTVLTDIAPGTKDILTWVDPYVYGIIGFQNGEMCQSAVISTIIDRDSMLQKDAGGDYTLACALTEAQASYPVVGDKPFQSYLSGKKCELSIFGPILDPTPIEYDGTPNLFLPSSHRLGASAPTTHELMTHKAWTGVYSARTSSSMSLRDFLKGKPYDHPDVVAARKRFGFSIINSETRAAAENAAMKIDAGKN